MPHAGSWRVRVKSPITAPRLMPPAPGGTVLASESFPTREAALEVAASHVALSEEMNYRWTVEVTHEV